MKFKSGTCSILAFGLVMNAPALANPQHMGASFSNARMLAIRLQLSEGDPTRVSIMQPHDQLPMPSPSGQGGGNLKPPENKTGTAGEGHGPAAQLETSSPAPFSPAFTAIERMTKRAAQKEIDLLKLNTYVRMQVGKDSPGKRWRALVYSNLNYALTFSGMVVNLIYNFAYAPRASKTPIVIQLAATTPRLVGKAIFITGTLIETAIQARESAAERRSGWDIRATDRRVSTLKSEIAELLSARSSLLAAAGNRMSEPERRLALLDSQLLDDAYQLCVREYADLHARAISKIFENRSLVTLTLLKKCDGDFGSDVVRVIGAPAHWSYSGGIASISTCISGTMAYMNPVLEVAARKLGHHIAYNDISNKLDVNNSMDIVRFERDIKDAEDTVSSLNTGGHSEISSLSRDRLDMFKRESHVLQDMQYLIAKENEEKHRHDVHTILIRALSGGSKAARGTMLIYVGFHYVAHKNAVKDLSTTVKAGDPPSKLMAATINAYTKQRNDHVGNHNSFLTGCAAIPYVAGTFIRECDILRTTYLELAHRKALKAKRSVAGVILQARLSSLNDLEEEAAKFGGGGT